MTLSMMVLNYQNDVIQLSGFQTILSPKNPPPSLQRRFTFLVTIIL